MKNKLLKKLALLLVSAMCMSIVGCGQSHTVEVSLSEDSEDDESEDVDDEDEPNVELTEEAAVEEVAPTEDSAPDGALVVSKSSLLSFDEGFHNEVDAYLEDCSYEYNLYKINNEALIIGAGYGVDSMTYAFYSNGSVNAAKCICPVARCFEYIYPEEGIIIVMGSGGAAASDIEIFDYKLNSLYYFYQDANTGIAAYTDKNGSALTREEIETQLQQVCAGLVTYDEEYGLFSPATDGTSYANLDSYLLATGITMDEVLAVCEDLNNE